MIKNLIKMNYRWWGVVFFAGATSGAIVGSLAGAALGFVCGSLLAPKSGEELRNDIAEKTEELAETVKERAIEKGQDLRKKISQFYSTLSTETPVETSKPGKRVA